MGRNRRREGTVCVRVLRVYLRVNPRVSCLLMGRLLMPALSSLFGIQSYRLVGLGGMFQHAVFFVFFLIFLNVQQSCFFGSI